MAHEPPLSDAEILAVRALLADLESGKSLLPVATASGQMIASGEGVFPAYDWKLVQPPEAAENQSLKFGAGDPPPYWPTQAAAKPAPG